jgi:hypothetical protein
METKAFKALNAGNEQPGPIVVAGNSCSGFIYYPETDDPEPSPSDERSGE